MQEILKSGNRMYTFETVEELPSIEELLLSTDDCKIFIDSVTLNPKDVNAQLYSQFTEETYRLFIYAFAYNIGQRRSTSSIFEQFEMNARRVKRLCEKRKIVLSDTETRVIDFCINFFLSRITFKDQICLSESLCAKLKESYL